MIPAENASAVAYGQVHQTVDIRETWAAHEPGVEVVTVPGARKAHLVLDTQDCSPN